MSEDVKKSVALDETLQRLIDVIRSQNAAQREQRDLLERLVKDSVTDDCLQDVRGELEALNGYQREQRDLLEIIANGKVKSEIYIVPVLCTAQDDGTFAYDLDGISFDDILGAYEDGKFIIMRIAYGENVYFATFVDFKVMTVPIGVSQTFDFFAHTLHDKQHTVVLYRMTKNSGSVTESLMVTPSGLAANQISCNVIAGGAECKTLDAALDAIVAALG